MTEAQDEKLATADEAFEARKKALPNATPIELAYAHSDFRAGWDARQAEVDRLAAENAELKKLHTERFNALLLTYETCAGLQERTARERDALRDQVNSCHAYAISQENDQLRELSGELARHIDDNSTWPKALHDKAKALGVEVGK